MFNTPILFIIFSRPDTTQLVFNAIRKQKPKFLFVAADGPRANKEGEREKCISTRQIIKQIDWDCEVKTLFRKDNLGCGVAVSHAISWFFEHVEQGIILEDDCVPHPDFYDYCEQLLHYYKENKEVMLISGDNFQLGKKRGNASYYFSPYTHIWGWATWKRTWKHFRYNVQELYTEVVLSNINRFFDDEKQQSYWLNKYNYVAGIENPSFWAYQLVFSIWSESGLSIIPNVNLISNIGFGNEATHTNLKDSIYDNITTKPILPLKHPDQIEINKKADKYYYTKFLDNSPSTFFKFKQLIKKLLPNFILKKIVKY